MKKGDTKVAGAEKTAVAATAVEEAVADVVAAHASPPPTNCPLAFLRAKLAVWEACPYLLKREGKGLKYTFASEADLIALVRPALIASQILVTPVASEIIKDGEFKTSGGSLMRRVIVRGVYRFTHVGTGWYEDVEMHGEGADIGDKAVNKAMTDCFKYAVRQWAMIETGDDPDKQSSEMYRVEYVGDEKAEPDVPANLRESYGKCKDALARATERGHLDQYRDIYTNKRGFPADVVAFLDKLYLSHCDRLKGAAAGK